MKVIVTLFLYCEAIDMLLTGIGLRLGLVELNPIMSSNLIVFKLIAMICVGLILQVKKQSWLDKVVVIVAGFPVAWNLINLML